MRNLNCSKIDEKNGVKVEANIREGRKMLKNRYRSSGTGLNRKLEDGFWL